MHRPIIILEGPDGVGKTTFAKAFCERFNGFYIHLTLRKNMHAHQVAALSLALRKSRRHPVIIDRHWPSEQIYAAVYRGGSNLQDEAKWMHRTCNTLGVFTLVCLAGSVDQMVKSHHALSQARNEMYEPSKKFEEVVRCYYDWWHGTNLRMTHMGFCEELKPMRTRHMASTLYDRLQYASPLALKEACENVHALAQAWRKFNMEDPFAQRLATQSYLLRSTLGYKSKLS
jgi:thymidylate kinase